MSCTGILLASAKSETRVFSFDGARHDFRYILPGMLIDASQHDLAILPTPDLYALAVISSNSKVQIIELLQ